VGILLRMSHSPESTTATATGGARHPADAGAAIVVRRGIGNVRQRAVWALTGYLIGVFLARVVTTVLHLRGAGANGGLIIHRVHIHHSIFGLTIMAVVTTMWMLDFGVDPVARGRVRLWTAAFWGFAWALILDEFALLLHLKDVYWLPTGDESLYAMFVFFVVLVLAVVLSPRIAAREQSIVGEAVVAGGGHGDAGGNAAAKGAAADDGPVSSDR